MADLTITVTRGGSSSVHTIIDAEVADCMAGIEACKPKPAGYGGTDEDWVLAKIKDYLKEVYEAGKHVLNYSNVSIDENMWQ